MGYSIYPAKPGSKYGPCEGECKHKDCAESRRAAASLCRICGKEIGWDNMTYMETNSEFVHAECVWEAEDRERAQRTKSALRSLEKNQPYTFSGSTGSAKSSFEDHLRDELKKGKAQ